MDALYRYISAGHRQVQGWLGRALRRLYRFGR